MSLQRILQSSVSHESIWIGPEQAKKLTSEEIEAYDLAHKIMAHLCVQAPTKHKSGHPGGPLSSFTFAYFLSKRRNPEVDQPLRMSAGHLSLLAYGLQWLFSREGDDPRLQSPQAIIDAFRTPSGLPGHAEAGIGDIPFGAGPLGKGVSNALGAAFGLKYLKKEGVVDVLMADGDCQEGQIMEAFRLASHLKVDNLVVHGDFNDIQLSDMPSKVVAADFAKIAAAAGWQVIEVQNGNDPGQVVAALDLADELLKKGVGPIFLCYYTTMGQGVAVMEEGSNTGTANYHGTPLKEEVSQQALKELSPLEELVQKYEKHCKNLKSQISKLKTHSETLLYNIGELKKKGYKRAITTEKGSARTDFGAVHIKNLMKTDPRIVVLHADLAGSGGYDKVAKEFPERVINVGVAEANMYMMAAGMRQVGLLPVTYTFATFGTNEARANARLIDINCSHTRCAVLHDCTHAGLSVGEDGETHQEQNYLNLPFRHTEVWCPADSNQSGAMAEAALTKVAEGSVSVYVMFGRLGHPQILRADGKPFYGADYLFEGKADVIREGESACILSYGTALHRCLEAMEQLRNVRLINVSCIRPLDSATITKAAQETGHLVVIEDHNTEGGLASRVADLIADRSLRCTFKRIGLRRYYPSGKGEDLLSLAGISAEKIAEAVKRAIIETNGK